MTVKNQPYSNFQWDYFDSMSEGPLRDRATAFIASVDWEALLQYAAAQRNGGQCSLLSHIGLGHNHMVRIIRFMDGIQWAARLRLPSRSGGATSDDIRSMMESEISTMIVVRQKTQVPVPEIYAYETSSNCSVKAPFMLMECLDGNVGMDLGMTVPREHQSSFFKRLAEIQVELSRIQLPKIGTIQRVKKDGTIEQGPIRGLGGPFDTATEFFRAWCAQAEFGLSGERLHAACGPFADEIIPSIASFPTDLARLASQLSGFDKGPFPLIHGDFGHNNAVVADDYSIIGLIDWEMAYAAPWELAGDLPLTLSTIPPPMDAPWNYNDFGDPKDPDLIQKYVDQKHYVAYMENAEKAVGRIGAPSLANALRDSRSQHLMTAMRLYQNGKAGFYSRLLPETDLRSSS